MEFLNSYKDTEIDHLVLLGDFFDFWRGNNAQIVWTNEDVMVKLNDLKTKEIHYVAGNHDYSILDLNKRYEANKEVTVSKCLRLEDNGESFFFIHGYELEVILWEFPGSMEMYEGFSKEMCFSGKASGTIMSWIWSVYEKYIKKFKKRSPKKYRGRNPIKKYMDRVPEERDIDGVEKLALSSGKYSLLGMKPHETLVFGHTHRPFIDQEKKVVNTGSWINDIEGGYQQNSYVEIKDGKMELKYFKEKKEKNVVNTVHG